VVASSPLRVEYKEFYKHIAHPGTTRSRSSR
jgi:hypothetical protein